MPGRGGSSDFVHTSFHFGEGGTCALERAWEGMWDKSMYTFMCEEGRRKVECVMMALRRFGIGGDVGAAVVGYMIGMEGTVADYF